MLATSAHCATLDQVLQLYEQAHEYMCKLTTTKPEHMFVAPFPGQLGSGNVNSILVNTCSHKHLASGRGNGVISVEKIF
jgi:hypothetical protein